MINDKMYSKIVFNAYKRHYSSIKTVEQLYEAKKAFYASFSDFGDYQSTISNFLEIKEKKIKKEFLNSLIKPFEESKPLKFNLKGLNDVKSKINKLDNPKLKYEFKGLFNLLNDHKNLIYNNLNERSKIIKDLNKFKSLKFFKVGYISRYDLKKEYRHLSYKNNAKKEHSKIYFIKSGLYVLKTLHHDNLSLKVFYIGKKYKTLLKSHNKCKKVLKGDKFNLSSVEAYKTLDKRDSMRYYSYCNDMGLNKSNRDLLRSIRSKRGGKSFYQLLEDTEDRIDILNDKIYQYYNSNDEPFPISDLVHYEWELKELEENLYDWTHENNSYAPETELGDYLW